MTLSFRPLSPVIGAEAVGFDPRQFSDDERDQFKAAWLQHLVMLIRTPNVLSDDEFVALMSRLGVIENARKLSPLSSRIEVMIISNIRENGQLVGALPDGELSFHYDRAHQKKPTRATALHAIEIPDKGGETCFANMCLAYETLPVEIKQKIAGKQALNTYEYGATHAEAKKLDDDAPSAVHPVVRTIPETGRKALFVARLMTDKILGLPDDESRLLLNQIADHCEQPKFSYEHHWQVGDILMWDNRCSTHARKDFDASQRRLMKRIALGDAVAPA